MIWSVVSKSEMEGFGTSPVFRFYREALGKDNVQLAVVDENDNLDFVKEEDIVLLRTASGTLINTIKEKKFKTTAESYLSYEIVADKEKLSQLLSANKILCPKQYNIDDVVDGKLYFVKPRFGSDSKCISQESICKTKEEVINRIEYIRKELNQDSVIEDFIEGTDCTIACVNDKEFSVYPVRIECDNSEGIMTFECKNNYNVCCVPFKDENVNKTAKELFNLIGIRHHARFDFRLNKNGDYYLIDINLLPGIGPTSYFIKCALLCENISYKDILRRIIGTADTLI